MVNTNKDDNAIKQPTWTYLEQIIQVSLTSGLWATWLSWRCPCSLQWGWT